MSTQDEKPVYNLILEYADRGSLLDFYQNEPPKTSTEVATFWSSLSKFLTAVEKIHNEEALVHENTMYGILVKAYHLFKGGCADIELLSIHHDLKPSNILIFSNSSDIYDFTPKLSDFGMSRSKVSDPSPTTNLGPYNDATTTFSR